MNRTTKILMAATIWASMGLSFALAGCNQPKGSMSGNVASQGVAENPKPLTVISFGEIDGCRIYKVTDSSNPGNTTTFYLATNTGHYGSCGVVKEAGR